MNSIFTLSNTYVSLLPYKTLITKPYGMKPTLSATMKALLLECYKRELEEKEPCNPSTHHFADELLIIAFITLKPHTYKSGERKAAYFITDKGREYIRENLI